ncbi:MarR family winged helix-turn-helix transcriptional regulator [Natronoflexus pectinivorans]|uniref:HTH-type transcriptional regulator SarZ n=1 Tax=Natronoflexus pectinivorans TaxID=682526 RepID=A0A4R2GG03_9BACT|nr:MarR family transcriptional regulator [Natronoflexus pectinivorans]TCO07186.1 DNA-binding MarR family transcriptional regulator [Natronoflexus pectinivorans]
MEYDQLKLENQLCFPVYAASRLIIREYQPFLDKLGITYPQYLVLMVLWETDEITVNEISGKLILNTNTVTPLLKRMEALGLIKRVRSNSDERKVLISLSDKGKKMREKAASIPLQLIEKINDESIDLNILMELKNTLNSLISLLDKPRKG